MEVGPEKAPVALVTGNQPQDLVTHAAEAQPVSQVTPVEISGGHFGNARIGPSRTTINKNVDMGGMDLRGAHYGTTNITYHISTPQGSMEPPPMGPPRPRIQKEEASSHGRERVDGSHRREEGAESSSDQYQLSDTIWMFRDIQLAKKAYVFAGEMRSSVLGTRPLAIKCITNYKEQNRREAKNLVKLVPHLNVVSIIHSDTYKGGPMRSMYIAMERCSTTSYKVYIEDRRAKNVPFNLKMAQDHARQVIEAIKHIHDNNIMHRDLKPGSILFSLCGKHIKIIDFGMSKEMMRGQSTTYLSTLEPGIDGFRAPEIYNQDNSVSKKADIYSLALVLYFLWSYGFHPFGDQYVVWIHNIKKGICCNLNRLKVSTPDMALALLQSMLSFNRAHRPTIDQVRSDPFIKLDAISALIESLELLWTGDIKDCNNKNVLPCEVYKSPNLQDDLEFDGRNWTFQMFIIRNLSLRSLMNVIDKPPSGYIVTSSKDDLKELVDKLKQDNQVAWIDIFNNESSPKVMMLMCHPDYPEVFGFFLPKPLTLIPMLEEFVSQEPPESHLRLRVKDMAKKTDIEKNIQATILKIPKPKTANGKSSDIIPSNDSQTLKEQCMSTQKKNPDTAEYPTTGALRKNCSGELIPWWIFTGF